MQEQPDEQRIPASAETSSPRPSDARIQKGSLRLFRLAGIDVFIHWSWLIVAYFRVQSRADAGAHGPMSYTSPVWYAVEYLAIFGIVLLHEFGHVLACRSVGGRANRIILWPLGGVALVDPPPRPGAVLWSVAAGPLVNVVLLAPTIGLAVLSHVAGWGQAQPDLGHFIDTLAYINGGLLVFNMLPVYPLDGGQILQALLWFVIGRAYSLMVAAVIGGITGLAVLLGALVTGQWWLSLVAVFVLLFSLAGFQRARGLLRILRAPRRKGTACPSCGSVPPVGSFWVCRRCLTRFDFFRQGGVCPTCSSAQDEAPCPHCGRPSPYTDWYPEVIALEEPSEAPEQPTGEPAPAPKRGPTSRPASPAERAGCAVVLAALAVLIGGLSNDWQRPWDLIVWAAGGARFGATAGGVLLRGWKAQRAREKLLGTWRLKEEDGQAVYADEEATPLLTLLGRRFEERAGDESVARGVCWIDPTTQPGSITFAAKTGPDRGKPCQGIYRLEGKVLTVCVALPGLPRPAEFAALPGVQRLRVYRRGRR
jgi:uncharacterized protein (TIGR03067 family)